MARLERVRTLSGALFVAVASAVACVALLAGDASAAELPKQLSNETTFTRWAHPATTAPIRENPDPNSRTITRLHYQTEDKQAEVYLALRSEVDAQGVTWILIRIPGKPNGRKGWVRQDDLNPLQKVTTQIIINRKTLRLTFKKNGKTIMKAPIGVGKASTPTPAGDFWVREKLRSLGAFYGPWAIGTSAYASISDWPGIPVVGIHGTNQPSLIPGRPSHGCVRMKNRTISRLVRMLPLGTPVKII